MLWAIYNLLQLVRSMLEILEVFVTKILSIKNLFVKMSEFFFFKQKLLIFNIICFSILLIVNIFVQTVKLRF